MLYFLFSSIFKGKIDSPDIWNSSNFNLTKLFHHEFNHAFSVFMNYKLTRCNQILCFNIDPKNQWNWNDRENFSYDSYKEMLENLEDHYIIGPQFRLILKEQMFDPASEELKKFLMKRNEIVENYKSNENKFLRIEELYEENFPIDWIKVINQQLFKGSQVNKTQMIMIEGGLNLMREHFKHLKGSDAK